MRNPKKSIVLLPPLLEELMVVCVGVDESEGVGTVLVEDILQRPGYER